MGVTRANQHGRLTDTLANSKKKGLRLERRRPCISYYSDGCGGRNYYRIHRSHSPWRSTARQLRYGHRRRLMVPGARNATFASGVRKHVNWHGEEEEGKNLVPSTVWLALGRPGLLCSLTLLTGCISSTPPASDRAANHIPYDHQLLS